MTPSPHLASHLSGDRESGLSDADTGEPLTPDDLGCTDREYDAAVLESLEEGGDVLVNGRLVYAD